MGSIPAGSQFFCLPLFIFTSLLVFHFCSSFFSLLFCPPLISSSPFPLPSFLFSFSYSFPIPFLSFSSSCFLIFFPFLFSFSLSSLFFIPDFFLRFPSSLLLIVFYLLFLALKFLSCCTSLPMGLLRTQRLNKVIITKG